MNTALTSRCADALTPDEHFRPHQISRYDGRRRRLLSNHAHFTGVYLTDYNYTLQYIHHDNCRSSNTIIRVICHLRSIIFTTLQYDVALDVVSIQEQSDSEKTPPKIQTGKNPRCNQQAIVQRERRRQRNKSENRHGGYCHAYLAADAVRLGQPFELRN